MPHDPRSTVEHRNDPGRSSNLRGGPSPNGPSSNGPSPNGPSPDGPDREQVAAAGDAGRPAQPGSVAATSQPAGDDREPAPRRRRRFLLLQAIPSWLISMVVHAIALMILALLSFPETQRDRTELLALDEVEHVRQFDPQQIEPLDVQTFQDMSPATPMPVAALEPQETTELELAEDIDSAPISLDLRSFAEATVPRSDLAEQLGTMAGEGFSGRGSAARAEMVQRHGGTEASERAVAAALRWLAAHQLPDGGWSFNHQLHPGCQRQCLDPGDMDGARIGATALALLPFLGAGQTHIEGGYQSTVEAGLYFLTQRMRVRNNMGELWEDGGRMYSHGLAAIVLTEAYGMTNDPALMAPAQLALNYIAYAQDPVGGGWRYEPRQPGDTSVVGWQLMALKSGHLSYLQVSPNTVAGASRFLDSVQTQGGARYGYTNPGEGQATTAIGLLSRMLLGWQRDHPTLEAGVQFLSETGPSTGDMYYNYYATQVLHHWGGDEWEQWNVEMRDFLVETQVQEGHMAGSWYMRRGDLGSRSGGRLYCTAMAAMVLEVYYRHMPIYGRQAAEDDFPL